MNCWVLVYCSLPQRKADAPVIGRIIPDLPNLSRCVRASIVLSIGPWPHWQGALGLQCSSLLLTILAEGMGTKQVVSGSECCFQWLKGIIDLLNVILDTGTKAQLMPNTGDTIQTKKRIKE